MPTRSKTKGIYKPSDLEVQRPGFVTREDGGEAYLMYHQEAYPQLARAKNNPASPIPGLSYASTASHSLPVQDAAARPML